MTKNFGAFSERKFRGRNLADKVSKLERAQRAQVRAEAGDIDASTALNGDVLNTRTTAFDADGNLIYNINPATGEMLTPADVQEINWWLPLTLADDDVTGINCQAIATISGIKYLYVGGLFARIGGVSASNIARYSFDARQWEVLGSGLNDRVHAIAIDSSGNVYAGGEFSAAGGDAFANYISKWNGTSWSALGSGLGNIVRSIAIDDSGNLYVGGEFSSAGGDINATRIAKWNGTSWSALGSGLNNNVYSISIDSSGNIYAGGNFTDAGGDANADRIAKWDGVSWSALGSGFSGPILSVVIDSFGNIYAGGNYIDGGGEANADRIAKWDGVSWSALGNGFNATVRSIEIDSFGNIYAGGDFTNANDDPAADRIAKWDGQQWIPLTNGGGISGLGGYVYSIVIDPDTDSVFAGGDFETAGTIKAASLACFVRPLADALDMLANQGEQYQARQGATGQETLQYGFVIGVDGTQETTISFNDSTYVFTLSGTNWTYYRDGKKCVIAGDKTVTLAGTPPTAGLYFIYIDADDGTLVASTSAWTLADTKVPVAIIAWNNSLTPKYWMADERHPVSYPRRVHHEHHFTDGTEIVTAPALSGYTVTPATPADTDNTFAISASAINDEGIEHILAALTDPNGTATDYVVFYRTAAAAWAWKASAMPYDYTAAGYINYDNAGTMTQGQNGKLYNSYLLLSNMSGAARFVLINGQAEFSTLAAAQGEKFGSLVKTGLPVAEYVACWQLTWSTNSSYSTKGKCRLAAAPVSIAVSASGFGSGAVTANAVSVTPAGNIASTNVQSALEELDAEKLALTGGTLTGPITVPGIDLANGSVRSYTVALNDDTATSFTPVTNTGIMHFATASAGDYGELFYRATASPVTAAHAVGANTNVTTGALTGTTGTDGKITISTHTDGKIYIENRRGAARTFYVILF